MCLVRYPESHKTLLNHFGNDCGSVSVNEVEALYELFKKISSSVIDDGLIHKVHTKACPSFFQLSTTISSQRNSDTAKQLGQFTACKHLSFLSKTVQARRSFFELGIISLLYGALLEISKCVLYAHYIQLHVDPNPQLFMDVQDLSRCGGICCRTKIIQIRG